MDRSILIDESKLEGFRVTLARRAQSPRRWAARSAVPAFLLALTAFFVLPPLLDGRLPTTTDFSTRRLAAGLTASIVLALLAGAFAYLQIRSTLRVPLAEHRTRLERDWAKWAGTRWLARTFGIGLCLTLGVGVPVGLLLALSSSPADLPSSSRPLAVLYFVGLTALWAFPFAFGLRWLALRQYRQLGAGTGSP